MFRIASLLLLTVAVLPAQTSFNYPSFPNATGLTLRGSTQVTPAGIRLTDQVSNQTGIFWNNAMMPVISGFETTFTFRITPPPVGRIAEGMAFIIQNSPAGLNALGGGVWALGYGSNGAPGISNSLAIELVDTYQDGFLGDTSNNELSVHTNGTGENMEEESFSIGRTTPAVNVGNGQVHTARIAYVPGTLEIYIDNLTTPVLSVAYDFLSGGQFLTGSPVGGLNLPNGSAFVGFSAANGAGTLTERVEILSWSWTSFPGIESCGSSEVGASVGMPIPVFQINGSTGDGIRRLRAATFDPLTLELFPGPSSALPADFILFAAPGRIPSPSPTPFGTLCFDPFLASTLPVFDSFGLLPALLPAQAAPFSLTLTRGLPVAGEWILQGLMVDGTAPTLVARTNAIVLETFLAPAPTIRTLTPTSGPGGTLVTATGTGFSPSAVLEISGQPAPFSSLSATAFSFLLPAALACDAPLSVRNPDGQAATFTLNPTPTVTRLIPTSGPAAGGTSLIILANGITSAATITLGGVPLTPVTSSSGFARVITPALPAGPQTLVITTPGGCTASATFTMQ